MRIQMDIDSSRIQELIERPGESLSVEIKKWIDPDSPEGIAKIVKAVLALRNYGGGYLIIGFDNATLKPDIENAPEKVREKFHIDKIQGLVSRFASEPFEVNLKFPTKEGQEYPVLIIPSDIKTPVASKSELDKSGHKLIKLDTVYVRSLEANNTPSTTQATWKDWPKIVDVCFDNREADIGKFLRRHLSGLSPEIVRGFASEFLQKAEPEQTLEDALREYLRESEIRFEQVVLERKVKLPAHGDWEVALLFIEDTIPLHTASQDFLNLLHSSNPKYTGWPVWLDSRGFSDRHSRPFMLNGIWESMVIGLETGWADHIDFMRFDPKGNFYLLRALEDDISDNQRVPEPMKVLDFEIPVIRSAEAIAVGMSFAKAMGCSPENTQLAFAFKWSKLHDRELVSWANPLRHISPGKCAYQNEVLSFLKVPLETPLSALGNYVEKAVQPLFEIFDGFSLDINVIEDLTQQLISREI